MPKSKRERKVALTRTVSKGRPRKAAIVDEVRACADAFKDAYVFTVDNMRGAPLKIVRQKLKNSRIFFGRNKLIAAAIGRSPQDAYRDEMHRLVEHLLGGEAGLIFTNETLETVRAKLAESEQPEYSRAGTEATSEVKLSPGDLDHFPHSMEPYLRKLGLPTRLTGGVVTLLCEHTVCNEGDELTSDQAKILQLLDIKMSTFKAELRCRWSVGEFEAYAEPRVRVVED